MYRMNKDTPGVCDAVTLMAKHSPIEVKNLTPLYVIYTESDVI